MKRFWNKLQHVNKTSIQHVMLAGACVFGALYHSPVQAGNQAYEPMAESVRLAMQASLEGGKTPYPIFDSAEHRIDWLSKMSARLAKKVPNFSQRLSLIKTIRYEAQRAGLDPQMVFSVIEVESNFNPNAVSPVGARGLMQVMPFWTRVLADGRADSLFNPRVNIRYGCVILRHYLDLEHGDMWRALARYNGSLGKDTYPNLIYRAFDRHWVYLEPESAKHPDKVATKRKQPAKQHLASGAAPKPGLHPIKAADTVPEGGLLSSIASAGKP